MIKQKSWQVGESPFIMKLVYICNELGKVQNITRTVYEIKSSISQKKSFFKATVLSILEV